MNDLQKVEENEESFAAEVRQKMLNGGKSLLVRQIILSGAGIVGTILMARMLGPRDFGLYAIVSFFVQFLTLMGDAGLGAGLIQKVDEPGEKLYNAAFWTVQLIFGAVLLLGLPVFLVVRQFYSLPSNAMTMVLVSLFSTYLTSFRIIPAAMLERKLLYNKLAIVETVEGVGFQVFSVVLASLGFGTWSFILGMLLSRLLGVLTIYRVCSFYPRLEFDASGIKELLKFGIARQGAGTVSFLREAIVPTLIGSTLGLDAVGYINWAQKVASYLTVPLNFFGRMVFPALARLQSDDRAFNALLNTIVSIYVTIVFGGLATLSAFLPETIRFVFSSKWLPAMPIAYWIFPAYLLIPFAFPIFDALTAKGKSNLVFLFSAIQLVMTWTIGLILIRFLGIMGYGVTYTLLQVAGILVFYLGRKLFKVDFRKTGGQFLALVVSIGLGELLKHMVPIHNVVQLGSYYVLNLSLYMLIVYLVSPDIRHIVKKMVKVMRRG